MDQVMAGRSGILRTVPQFEKYESFCRSLGRKWRMRILCNLAYSTELRYSQIKSVLSPITHKMLSEELGKLVEEGFVIRQEQGGVPVKVVYSLSDKGRDLLYSFTSIADWVDRH